MARLAKKIKMSNSVTRHLNDSKVYTFFVLVAPQEIFRVNQFKHLLKMVYMKFPSQGGA